MVLDASMELNDFLFKNDMYTIKFVGYVGHKENRLVYGGLFETNKGLLFQQHKWTVVNKNDSVPKVYARCLYTQKIVTEEIYNSFDIIDEKEHSDRWGTDLAKI